MKLLAFVALTSLTSLTTAQNSPNTTLNDTWTTEGPRNVRIDTGTYGPEVEDTGRAFACYTLSTYAYTLGEIVNETAEATYPSLELNNPPRGLYNVMNSIQFGSNDSNHFISVQALFITPDDTLWVLDTSRPTINESQAPSMPYAAPGGPKLNIHTSSKCPLPRLLHDLRFDMRANVTESGSGIANIVDSSNERRTGFIMIDLSTGESWRQLLQHPSTLRTYAVVLSYQGIPNYFRQKGSPLGFQQEGLDGVELSLYGDIMYYSPLTSDYLYLIETSYLRSNPSNDTLSAKRAFDNVKNLGQRGGNADGFSGDNLGNIYMRMPKNNAIYIYNSTTLQATPANVGFYGYIYFNINQLPYQLNWNNGIDGRQHPGLILRSILPGGANKNMILGRGGPSNTTS
ncbi:hypothetical protein B0J14DRAFT_622409 [Halenospora varia]|nr:hypothetical protein B0J14DRAFT_622409 [Halenospora varia]